MTLIRSTYYVIRNSIKDKKSYKKLNQFYDKLKEVAKSHQALTKLEGSNIISQLISKCPFGVFKSPKKPMKFFPGFLP